MKVIALYNIKGGVGKTTSCVNLAAAAALRGFKTLVWDLDPQQAASKILLPQFTQSPSLSHLLHHEDDIVHYIHETTYPDLSVIPADLSFKDIDIMLKEHKYPAKKLLKQLIKRLKTRGYDFLFLDCTPAFSELADAIFKVADVVLMPIIPSTLSLQSFELIKRHFEDKGIDDDKLMCFFNLVDIRRKLHLSLMAEYAVPYRFFQYYIPNASDIEKTASEQCPIVYARPSSIGAASYKALWQELEEGLV